MDSASIKPDTYAALKESNYQRFMLGNLFFHLGKQMLVVAIGWEIYERTHSAMALGYIGLAQVIPVFLLTLPAGHIADNNDRRKVVIAAQILMGIATLSLFFLSFYHRPVEAMYLCLLLIGAGRSFNSPANASLLPQVVSEKNFTNAVTWNSVTYQIASVVGPSIAGFLLAVYKHAWLIYLIDFGCIMLLLTVLMSVKLSKREIQKKAMTLQSLMAGLKFVWSTEIILAAITLDLFAVLFGGATSLLPIYAKDILHVGARGLGLLQAAPSLGAILMAFIVAKKGEFRNSGKMLLWAVVAFGLCMMVFGMSHWFWLSLLALFFSGAADNISVVIRQSLVQLRTPDHMRGRVSAINYVFIGASNELGGFESGLVAQHFGPVFSVVSGGIATIITVIASAWAFPGMRKLDRLHEDAALSSEATLLENS